MSQHGMDVAQPGSDHRPVVLIIDDEAEVRSVLHRVVVKAGFAATEASGGEAAIELMDAGLAPDAILCDVLMPTSCGGVEVHRMVTERFPQFARGFIFLSGVSEEEAVQLAIEGTPLYSKLDDLQLVVDAIRLTVRQSQIRKASLSGL